MSRTRWVLFAVILGGVALALAGCFIITNLAPQASFTAVPASGTSPLVVHFDASASNDPDGQIVAYFWDFGDTQTGSGVALDHTFTVQSESRVFTVILTVTDDDGATGQATKNIAVNP